jgi:GGDEF domain-containing protein
VIQIDHFPDLAQRLGHEAAERLLTMVERTVEQCLRPDEDSLRLPGGVILVTLGSGTSLTGLGNKLLGLIQSARLQWWGETVTITTSIGGAAVGPHDTMADTVRRAEDCALRASESGGSQMVLATS